MKLSRPGLRKRVIIAAVIVAVSGALVFGLLKFLPTQQDTHDDAASSEQSTDANQSSPSSLTFAAMGDMLAHDSVVRQAKTADGYDFTPYFSEITPLYEGKDVVFCNLETPSAGEEYGISGYPTFNAPTEFARDASGSGCNLINLATNHLADKGQAALNATLDEWEQLQPLAVTGANRSADEQQHVRYFEKNGLKVAFVAFADFSNAPLPHEYSVNIYHDEALVRQLLGEARQNADVVIVSAHWGTEDSHEVNADQQQAAQLFADLGADVIIGTGPHVVQQVDWLDRADGGRTLVWYSIGNMLSSQLQTDELTGGVATFTVAKGAQGLTFSDIGFRGTFMSYEWSEADKAAENLLARQNLKLQPLQNAGGETQLFGVTVEERAARLREWLGTGVEMTITP